MKAFELILTTLGLTSDRRWDAKFTAVLEKALEYVKTKTYDIVYPDFKSRLLIPVSHDADPGAETITYRQWDEFGMAQIIANYGDDLPLIDSLVEEYTQKVKSLGAAYQYSIQDLRRSAMSGAKLDQRRARGCRRSIEFKIDDIAALGDTRTGLRGLVKHPNVPLVSPTTGTWSTATALQIIADMNKLVNSVVVLTKEVFLPDTLLLDLTNYNHIASMPMTVTGDAAMTVLKFFLTSNPYITQVGSWNKLTNADVAGTGPRAVCYKKDPEVLTLEIPQEFEQMPAQTKNLAFVVPAHARIGGVIMYYPMAVAYMDGL